MHQNQRNNHFFNINCSGSTPASPPNNKKRQSPIRNGNGNKSNTTHNDISPPPPNDTDILDSCNNKHHISGRNIESHAFPSSSQEDNNGDGVVDDDEKKRSASSARSTTSRPARQAVLRRVEYKMRTKKTLYDNEMLKRSQDYAKKHPGGYKLSQEQIANLVPPAAKHKTLSTTTPCSNTAAKLHSEATALLNDDKHDEAIEKYHSALQHTPREHTQLVCSLQFKLAQCLLSHYSTDIAKLDECLQVLDSGMRHRSGDEKSFAIKLAVLVHDKILEHEDCTTAEGLNSVICSIFVQRRYIKELGRDEELDRIMNSNSKY